MATATATLSQSDFAPQPTTVLDSIPQYKPGEPGFAEIKKHNIRGIRGGLQQLSAHPKKKTQRCFLITYKYAPSSVSAVSEKIGPRPSAGTERTKSLPLSALVLEPYGSFNNKPADQLLEKPITQPATPWTPASVQKWLDGLGTWYSIGTEEMVTYSSAEWLAGDRVKGKKFRHPLQLQPFGYMVEVELRDRFLQKFGGSKGITDVTGNTLPKSSADVSWQEIAEYLYELAYEVANGSSNRN